MATNTATHPGDANAFALAVTVLKDRIATLPQADRDDLFELLPDLLGNDVEAQQAAQAAVDEILAKRPTRVVACELPDEGDSELGKWLTFIGQRVREARQAAHLTQVELADRAGIPQPHLSRIERGRHSPTAMTREKLAKALNLPASTFDPSA